MWKSMNIATSAWRSVIKRHSSRSPSCSISHNMSNSDSSGGEPVIREACNFGTPLVFLAARRSPVATAKKAQDLPSAAKPKKTLLTFLWQRFYRWRQALFGLSSDHGRCRKQSSLTERAGQKAEPMEFSNAIQTRNNIENSTWWLGRVENEECADWACDQQRAQHRKPSRSCTKSLVSYPASLYYVQ